MVGDQKAFMEVADVLRSRQDFWVPNAWKAESCDPFLFGLQGLQSTEVIGGAKALFGYPKVDHLSVVEDSLDGKEKALAFLRRVA